MRTILGNSLSDAYVSMLRSTLNDVPLLQVTSVLPCGLTNIDRSDSVRIAFESYTFPDGRTGQSWIQNRIKALFDEKGEYWRAMHRDGQFDYVVSTLKGMRNGRIPRWNANRLILTLFDPKTDLHICRAPTPPCLINVCFYPIKQTLSLVATFRAQYTDAKGYGNLLSLAMLLKQVSGEAGFSLGQLCSIAQKVTLKYPRAICEDLLNRLILVKEKGKTDE